MLMRKCLQHKLRLYICDGEIGKLEILRMVGMGLVLNHDFSAFL
jgi:hypothetical protein